MDRRVEVGQNGHVFINGIDFGPNVDPASVKFPRDIYSPTRFIPDLAIGLVGSVVAVACAANGLPWVAGAVAVAALGLLVVRALRREW